MQAPPKRQLQSKIKTTQAGISALTFTASQPSSSAGEQPFKQPSTSHAGDWLPQCHLSSCLSCCVLVGVLLCPPKIGWYPSSPVWPTCSLSQRMQAVRAPAHWAKLKLLSAAFMTKAQHSNTPDTVQH